MSYFAYNPLHDCHVDLAARALQNLANQIIEVLVNGGSRVRQLGWLPAPDAQPKAPSAMDANAHCWPEYVYFRGRSVDGMGRAKSVAVPVANFRKELESWAIFNCYQRT
jgi:hypothetical protein